MRRSQQEDLDRIKEVIKNTPSVNALESLNRYRYIKICETLNQKKSPIVYPRDIRTYDSNPFTRKLKNRNPMAINIDIMPGHAIDNILNFKATVP